MPDNNLTIRDQEELLFEKGYLHPSFMTASQLGEWLKEFREQYQQCYDTAIFEDTPCRFSVQIRGKFNEQLDEVIFQLRYQFDPSSNALILEALQADLGKTRKNYRLEHSLLLPPAQKVYEILKRPDLRKRNKYLWQRLRKEFFFQRNPENDGNSPPKLDYKRKSRR